MKKTQLLLIIVMSFLVFSNLYALKKEAYIFPIFSVKSEQEICNRFTELLTIDLEMSEVFSINVVRNINTVMEEKIHYLSPLIKTVNKKSEELGLNLVIFGYINKRAVDYVIKVVLYSPGTGNILTTFIDYFDTPEELERMARKCAVDLGYKIYSQRGSNLLLYSAVCPGLGQFFTDKLRWRGLIYFSGFTYFLVKYVSLGSKKPATPWSEFRLREFGGVPTLTVGGNVYNYGSFLWKMKENKEAMDFNEKLEKDKKNFITVLGIIYGLNMLDILFSTKKYNDRSIIEKRVTFGINRLDNAPAFCLKLKF